MTAMGYETEGKKRNLQSVLALNKKAVGEALLPKKPAGEGEGAGKGPLCSHRYNCWPRQG